MDDQWPPRRSSKHRPACSGSAGDLSSGVDHTGDDCRFRRVLTALKIYKLDSKYLSSNFEPPGPRNGWNQTRYVRDARRSQALKIVESPKGQNSWKRRPASCLYSIIRIYYNLNARRSP